MEDNVILALQEEYLQTGDTKVLENLYNNIMRLSYFSLVYGQFYNKTYDELDEIVKDVSSSIIMRLIEKKEPIIMSNPLSYLQRAILYSSKPKTKNKIQFIFIEDYDKDLYMNDLDDCVFEEANEIEFNKNLEKFFVKELSWEEDDDVRETLKKAVKDCIEKGKDYHKYIYKLKTKTLKLKFCTIMEDLEVYLNESK